MRVELIAPIKLVERFDEIAAKIGLSRGALIKLLMSQHVEANKK